MVNRITIQLILLTMIVPMRRLHQVGYKAVPKIPGRLGSKCSFSLQNICLTNVIFTFIFTSVYIDRYGRWTFKFYTVFNLKITVGSGY